MENSKNFINLKMLILGNLFNLIKEKNCINTIMKGDFNSFLSLIYVNLEGNNLTNESI